jgi:hypothetical protein
MSDYNNENQDDTSGQDQTEGGGEAGGGEETSEADMIFTPETSKPGRNAGMLMVAFVLIGVGVIYFMRARGGPSQAKASAALTKADADIKGFINDRDQIRKMTEMIKNTEKVVEQFTTYGEMPQVPVEELKKLPNIFVYVPEKGKPTKAGDPSGGRDKALKKFREQLDELRVQYLMVGAVSRVAMVNNKLLKEGQEIDGFVIDQITTTEVMVSKTVDGFEFKAAKKTTK